MAEQHADPTLRELFSSSVSDLDRRSATKGYLVKRNLVVEKNGFVKTF